jgi:hypothetical protein
LHASSCQNNHPDVSIEAKKPPNEIKKRARYGLLLATLPAAAKQKQDQQLAIAL